MLIVAMSSAVTTCCAILFVAASLSAEACAIIDGLRGNGDSDGGSDSDSGPDTPDGVYSLPQPSRVFEKWRDMARSWDLDELEAVIMDEHAGQTLRQSFPLGPALSPRERWAVLRQANEELGASGSR